MESNTLILMEGAYLFHNSTIGYTFTRYEADKNKKIQRALMGVCKNENLDARTFEYTLDTDGAPMIVIDDMVIRVSDHMILMISGEYAKKDIINNRTIKNLCNFDGAGWTRYRLYNETSLKNRAYTSLMIDANYGELNHYRLQFTFYTLDIVCSNGKFYDVHGNYVELSREDIYKRLRMRGERKVPGGAKDAIDAVLDYIAS